MFSSLGEFKLLDVKDMLKDLNVQPMYVSSAQAIGRTGFSQDPECTRNKLGRTERKSMC